VQQSVSLLLLLMLLFGVSFLGLFCWVFFVLNNTVKFINGLLLLLVFLCLLEFFRF
jgi:hypothetical protein